MVQRFAGPNQLVVFLLNFIFADDKSHTEARIPEGSQCSANESSGVDGKAFQIAPNYCKYIYECLKIYFVTFLELFGKFRRNSKAFNPE